MCYYDEIIGLLIGCVVVDDVVDGVCGTNGCCNERDWS